MDETGVDPSGGASDLSTLATAAALAAGAVVLYLVLRRKPASGDSAAAPPAPMDDDERERVRAKRLRMMESKAEDPPPDASAVAGAGALPPAAESGAAAASASQAETAAASGASAASPAPQLAAAATKKRSAMTPEEERAMVRAKRLQKTAGIKAASPTTSGTPPPAATPTSSSSAASPTTRLAGRSPSPAASAASKRNSSSTASASASNSTSSVAKGAAPSPTVASPSPRQPPSQLELLGQVVGFTLVDSSSNSGSGNGGAAAAGITSPGGYLRRTQPQETLQLPAALHAALAAAHPPPTAEQLGELYRLGAAELQRNTKCSPQLYPLRVYNGVLSGMHEALAGGASVDASVWTALQVLAVDDLLDQLEKNAAGSSSSSTAGALAMPEWARRDAAASGSSASAPDTPADEFLLRLGRAAPDGMGVPSPMLVELGQRPAAPALARALIRQALAQFGKLASPAEVSFQLKWLLAARTLAQAWPLAAGAVMSRALLSAADRNSRAPQSGNQYDARFIMASLMGFNLLEPRANDKLYIEEYAADPNSVRARENVASLVRRLQDGHEQVLSTAQELMRAALKTEAKTQDPTLPSLGGQTVGGREAVLRYLASVVHLAEKRLLYNDHTQRFGRPNIDEGHAFALNFCTLLLRFCEPFITKPDKLAKVDPSFSLVSQRVSTSTEAQLGAGQVQPPPEESVFNFMTEIFHITHRALHSGLLVVSDAFKQHMQAFHHQLQTLTPNTDPHAKLSLQLSLAADKFGATLFAPATMDLATNFYLGTALWLDQLMDAGAKGRSEEHGPVQDTLAAIPEYMVKDLAAWFSFVAQHQPRALDSPAINRMHLETLIPCCARILRFRLMPSPVVAGNFIHMFKALMQPGHHRKRGFVAGPESAHDSRLAITLLGEKNAKKFLVPAVVTTYVAVDMVAGLDVDKEAFDKYPIKADAAALLIRLFGIPEHRARLAAMAADVEFAEFVDSMLNQMLFISDSAFAAMREIKACQRIKANPAEWQALGHARQVETNNNLKKMAGRVAASTASAEEHLSLLAKFAQERALADALVQPRLATRIAAVITHYISMFAGPGRSDTEGVADFSPYAILVQVALVCGRLGGYGKAFAAALAEDVDYSRESLESTIAYVRSSQSMQITPAEIETFAKVPEWVAEAGAAGGAAAVGVGGSQQLIAEAVCSADEYAAALQPLQLDFTNMRDGDSDNYVHAHAKLIREDGGQGGAAKMKRLMREMKDLRSHSALPLHPNAAIFLRQDEDRADVMRALISGPVDTPYSLALFVFDIFLPADYPNVPPLVLLTTTGQGRVRFNPNLYNDGKVCLSLLGTWHGDAGQQKWSPERSNIYQVLVGIQSDIMVPEPYYNEPGVGGQGTPEGNRRSEQYNAVVREGAIRYAMLDMLMHPPAGFEDIVRTHFRLNRSAVLKQCRQWQAAAPEDSRARVAALVDRLEAELAKL